MLKNSPLSYIELSRANFLHNIAQFKKLLKAGTKVAAVVKANAYGHGDKETVKILNRHVDFFQVNSIEELESIRGCTKKPILVLGYIGKNDLEKAIQLGCILGVFDLHHALLVNECARRLNVQQKIHVAVDSYLGREGLMPDTVKVFLNEVKRMKYLTLDGMYAHFANIEDTSDFSHAKKQIAMYHTVLETFKEAGFGKIHTHISATSGILAYEKGSGINPIVRLGIGMYGMWPSEALQKKYTRTITLKPVLRWVTHIAQIKTLPKGHSVGYGLTYVTKKPTTIAVIPQGYSNGFDRRLSNNSEVLIGGKRAPILGRVAMNMFVVNISDIKNVVPEDEVILLGSQKNEHISAEKIALRVGTINYEITTHLNPLLPKIIH